MNVILDAVADIICRQIQSQAVTGSHTADAIPQNLSILTVV